MQTYRARPLDATKILTRREMAAVLNDLKRKAPRSKNTRMNLVLFRLACCCGLRASEIAKLQVGDVRTELARPHIRIRNGAAKGGRARVVPLWWDSGTLEDLATWKADRLRNGAEYDEPFLASLIPGRAVKPFSRHTLRKRFRTACKLLGAARLESLTIHHGRQPITLGPDGVIAAAERSGSWQQNGASLVLRWKDARSTSANVEDHVILEADGRSYVGRNSRGEVVFGLRER